MIKVSKYIIVLIAILVISLGAQEADSLKINYSLINSVPQNADVYLNEVKIGSTPLYFSLDSNISPITIKLKAKGYLDYEYKPASSLEIINKTFTLVPVKGNLRSSIVHENMSYAFPKKMKVVPMIISSVVTAVSAVMAYYYKSLAIDKQDEFYFTGNPSLLDDKKRYDVLGGVSLAVFQIGFGALLYYHFIE